MSLNGLAQCFPVQMQRRVCNRIQVFLVGVDRQNAFRIGGFVKPRACALLFRQLVRRFQQVILDRFERFVGQVVRAAVGVTLTVFRQPVGEVDDADTQRTTAHCAAFRRRDWVILVVQQGVERTDGQHCQLFQLVQALNRAQVERRQRTQRDFAVFVVHVFQRFGRQGDLQAQVRLAHWRNNRIKRAVGVAVVNVLDVDTAGRGTFLHHQGEQIDRLHALFTDAVVFFVFGVQTFELVLIGEERVIQTRDIGRAEQGNVFTFQQTGVHQFVDLHAVVHVTHAVTFNTTVVFQYQQAFDFQVPHWVEQGCRTTAHAALRAGFYCRLEVLVERDTTGMERFTAANWAAQGANAAGVDTDTCTLGDVFDNRAGGRVDGIQAVTALDQYAGAELTGWGTHARHNRRRQRNLERRDRIIETLNVFQTGVTRVVREQAGGHQNIEELGALVDFARDTVLDQVFAFELFHRCVGEVHITPVIDKPVHLLELFFRIVFQQMRVVFTQLNHFHHVVVKRRRLELAVGFFTQVENRQTCSEVLIIRRFAGDQIRRRFDDGFVDIRRFDAVVELNMGTQFNLGDRYVVQAFCCPVENSMDFVQIDTLGSTVALCHQQTLIHVGFTCP